MRIIYPFRVIDLTHAITENVPVWPGTMDFRAVSCASYESDGFFSRVLQLDEHFGTHLDAPAHYNVGACDVSQIPVENLICFGAVIDIRSKVNSGGDVQLISADILKNEETYGPIPQRSVVLLHTGWAQYWDHPSRYLNMDNEHRMHFPGFSLSAVRWLAENRNIVGIGVDTLSLDGGSLAPFEVHHYIANKGIYGVENLTNLDLLPARNFLIIVAPLPLSGGSGSPIRVFALIPKT